MLNKYLQGLDEKDKELAQREFDSSAGFRSRLRKVIEDEISKEFNSILDNLPSDSENAKESVAKIKSYKKIITFLK